MIIGINETYMVRHFPCTKATYFDPIYDHAYDTKVQLIVLNQ